MICLKCGKTKVKKKKCKFCKRIAQKKYNHSINGFLIRKYSHFQTREKQTEGRVLNDMDKKNFIKSARKDLKFLLLYVNWRISRFNSWQVPSIDRIDDSKHYSPDNIKWMTWKDNYRKECLKKGYDPFATATPFELPPEPSEDDLAF